MPNQKGYWQLVEKSGLRWAQLAAMTGIRSARLSEWKNGKTELQRDELRKIAAVIDSRLLELSQPVQFNRLASIPARGLEIRRERLRFGISQGTLAKKAGMAQFEISLFETGSSSMTSEQATRLEEALLKLAGEQVAALTSEHARFKTAHAEDAISKFPLLGLQTNLTEEEKTAVIAHMARYRLERIDAVRRDPDKFLREQERELRRAGRELGSQERQIEILERQLAGMAEQVAALREQNASLREWLDQETVAALEHSKAKELEEKVVATEEEKDDDDDDQ